MKRRKNNILVLGYFGYVDNQLDGQTVKTRDIYKLLDERYPAKVDFYDTQEFKRSRLSIFRMFYKICRCDTLIYLPAQNNLKSLFPIIFLLSRIFKFRIQYFVVGGWLSDFIADKSVHKRMLGLISGIHVETKRLKEDLEQNYGFRNVDIFPNFRFRTSVVDTVKEASDKLRLVFISRICEPKGLDILKALYESAMSQRIDTQFTIDFYGQVTDDYFKKNLIDIPIYRYVGVLQPDEVIATLRQYDALIFPTHYEGEGCPGILVESLFAGIPIIASDWKYNSEFVDDGFNGILCDTYNIVEYEEAIRLFADNKDLLKTMSINASKKAADFSADKVSEKLIQIL